MAKIKSEKILKIIICICAVFVIGTSATIFIYVNSFSSPDDTVHISARNDVKFKVYYIENNVFETKERPANLHYLMSYIDYIEIENSFTGNFSQRTEMSYSYTVTETLIIKNQQNIVYEKKTILADMNGSIAGELIFFNSENNENEPGGTYIIEPKKHISVYRQRVQDKQAQIQKEDVTAEKPINFSAELVVEIAYSIRARAYGVSETLTHSIIIPLSNEVFTLGSAGTSLYNQSIILREFEMPGMFAILLFLLWFAANIFGIIRSIYQLTLDKNERRREVKKILKKYSDEIIILSDSADLSEYKIIIVPQFKELLKLAVNLNKHILCFHDDEKAEFCTIVDGYSYCYNVYYYDKYNQVAEEKEIIYF